MNWLNVFCPPAATLDAARPLLAWFPADWIAAVLVGATALISGVLIFTRGQQQRSTRGTA